jgi:membrane-bound metal-dependent hydrolase YbcI (DUF457 family)
MLVFCHLVAGCAIGLAADYRFGDRRLIAAGAIGAVIPDVIDKPVGHILLAGSLDNGRIFSHTFAFILFTLLACTVFFRRRVGKAGPVLALGILSHQVLDAMWRDPEGWLYPLLGPFVPGRYPEYFLNGLIAEVSTPFEWLFGAIVLLILVSAYRPSFVPSSSSEPVRHTVPIVAIIAAVTGLYSIVVAVAGFSNPISGLSGLGDNLIIGGTALAGAGVLIIRHVHHEPAPSDHSS